LDEADVNHIAIDAELWHFNPVADADKIVRGDLDAGD